MNFWSEKEDAVIRERYGEIGADGVALLIDRKPTAIRKRASRLRVKLQVQRNADEESRVLAEAFNNWAPAFAVPGDLAWRV